MKQYRFLSNKGKVPIYSGLCILILMLLGCSNAPIRQFVRPDIDIHLVRTVAVLPFNNFTNDEYAAEKVRSKINIELLSRGIDVVEPGEIVIALRGMKIRSINALSSEDIITIGSMVNADKVITGSVEAYAISRGINVSYPEVSIHMSMIDAVSGKTVWSVWHTNGGASFWTRHFGTEGSTLDSVSEQVVKEAFDSFFRKTGPVYARPSSGERTAGKDQAMRERRTEQTRVKIKRAREEEPSGGVKVKIQFAPVNEEPVMPVKDIKEGPSREVEEKEKLPIMGELGAPFEKTEITKSMDKIN